MSKKINPHLNILVQLARIDGSADESELELIRQIGSTQDISDEDIEFAIKSTESSDTIEGVTEFSAEEKLELMYNLVLVMKADGIVHKEEMKFCLEVIKKMGFHEDALFELVSHTRVDESLNTDKADLIDRAKKYLSK